MGMPLQAEKDKRDLHNGYPYTNKWITGDYDLMDLVMEGGDCERPPEGAETMYGRIQAALNKRMKWSGIQHGAQAQWDARARGEGTFSMPEELGAWLKAPAGTPLPPPLDIGKGRKLPVCDDKLTRVGSGKVTHVDTLEDVKNSLICEGCAK